MIWWRKQRYPGILGDTHTTVRPRIWDRHFVGVPVVLGVPVVSGSQLLPDTWKQSHPDAVRTYREAESRYKAERKPLSRAKRLLAAKEKHKQNQRRQA